MKRFHLFQVCLLLIFITARQHAQIPIALSGTLPSSVNNSTLACFPPIPDQGQREACGNATGIGYGFSYEINAARNASAGDRSNQYPYFFTFGFLNAGSETIEDTPHVYYRHFLPAWRIVRENGIPNVNDFGTTDLNSTRWLSGYDKYFRAMQNRVDKIDSFAVTDTSGLRKMKQWLFDHGNGSSIGGILIFTANIYSTQEVAIPSGPEAGKTMVKNWGSDLTSFHAMAIVGYNDSVRYDFNGDGKFTDNIDISNSSGALGADGKLTMADWEVGAFIAGNSWGTAAWDNGLCYAPYRTLVTSPQNGGLLNGNRVYFLTVKKSYAPRLALKINMTDNVRNTIALSVGVAADQAAVVPEKIRRFDRQFTYSGGAYPLCGKGASASIEIGFDVSDLLDSIGNVSPARFFLVIDSKEGTGTVDSLSLMDYTSGTLKQTKSAQVSTAIRAGTTASPATTCVGVDYRSTVNGVKSNPLPSMQNGFGSRFKNEILQIAVPLKGDWRVTLYTVQGKRYHERFAAAEGGWISFPGYLPKGAYIVSAKQSDGRGWTGMVNTLR
jgi:hypothetical protein